MNEIHIRKYFGSYRAVRNLIILNVKEVLNNGSTKEKSIQGKT